MGKRGSCASDNHLQPPPFHSAIPAPLRPRWHRSPCSPLPARAWGVLRRPGYCRAMPLSHAHFLGSPAAQKRHGENLTPYRIGQCMGHLSQIGGIGGWAAHHTRVHSSNPLALSFCFPRARMVSMASVSLPSMRSQAQCISLMGRSAFQTALFTLNPLPKPICSGDRNCWAHSN